VLTVPGASGAETLVDSVATAPWAKFQVRVVVVLRTSAPSYPPAESVSYSSIVSALAVTNWAGPLVSDPATGNVCADQSERESLTRRPSLRWMICRDRRPMYGKSCRKYESVHRSTL
jgi:hypothetical protein